MAGLYSADILFVNLGQFVICINLKQCLQCVKIAMLSGGTTHF